MKPLWLLQECLQFKIVKCLALILLSISSFTFHAKGQRQTNNSFRSKFGPNALVGYLAYVPADYYTNPTKNYPILIFLHGMGEKVWNPQDISRLGMVKKYGPPKLIEEGTNFPFIVISPQCPFPGWDDVTTDGFNTFQYRAGEFVDEILEKMKTLYRVDANRIYITGVSMGGASTWEYIHRYPQKVAAAIPIAGWINAYNTCNLAKNNVAIWTFQGGNDGGANIQGYVNQINACVPSPSPRAKATVYPNVGHDAWTITYNNTGPGIAPDNIYDWLMRHSKAQALTGPVPAPSPSPTPTPVPASGLTMQLYPTRTLTGTPTTSVVANVNFNWGTGSPTAGYPYENFSARWTGFVQPQFNETYTFYTSSDDGIRLWVNEQLIIDNWTDHAPVENKGQISLIAGQKYSLKLEYYEAFGGAEAKMFWSSPSLAKQVVPQDKLFVNATAAREENEEGALLSETETSLSAFPVPAEDKVTLSWSSGVAGLASIQVLNELSEVVTELSYSMIIGSNNVTVNTANLKSGVYTVRTLGSDRKKVAKIVVAH